MAVGGGGGDGGTELLEAYGESKDWISGSYDWCSSSGGYHTYDLITSDRHTRR